MSHNINAAMPWFIMTVSYITTLALYGSYFSMTPLVIEKGHGQMLIEIAQHSCLKQDRKLESCSCS